MIFTDNVLNSSQDAKFSYVGAVTGSSLTVSFPSSTARAGDLAILFQGVTLGTGHGTSLSTPNGAWSSITASSINGNGVSLAYKILTSSDLDRDIPTMFGYNTTTGVKTASQHMALFFRPSDVGFPVVKTDNMTFASNSSGTTITNPTISMSPQIGPYLAFAAYYAGGAITTRGDSAGSLPNEVAGPSTQMYFKYGIYNTTSGTNTTISMTNTGQTRLHTGIFAFNPKAVYTYRIIEFQVENTTGIESNPVEVSEFQPMLNGVSLDLSTVTVTGDTANGSFPLTNVKDSNLSTKYVSNVSITAASEKSIIYDFGTPVSFNAYRWGTSDGATNRDPTGWDIRVGNGTAASFTIASVNNYATTSSRNTYEGPFTL